MDKLKAFVAAGVSLAVVWANRRFGFNISPETEAVIVGAIVGLFTYLVPNAKTA